MDHATQHGDQVLKYSRRRKAAAIGLLLAAAVDCCETEVESAVACVSSSSIETVSVVSASGTVEERGGTAGRDWEHKRNDPEWLFQFAMRPQLRFSPVWKALFRVSPSIFDELCSELGPSLAREHTRFRPPVRPEKRIAAFLMYCGGANCEKTAAQLGMGRSTVNGSVHEVSRLICATYKSKVSFPNSEEEITKAMSGFKNISGLPYCVGAMDGTHIPWKLCPSEQFYEYRCYKGFASIVLFACCTSNRRFTFVDIGRPGVLGDSSIFERSMLKKNIDDGVWLGAEIDNMDIAGVKVRPYLMGDCAFSLSINVMKTTSEKEQRCNPVLKEWEGPASCTRKPIECAFGMLKGKFAILKEGIRLLHENDISFLIFSCVILHNTCLDQGEQDEYESNDELIDDKEEEVVTAETDAGKRQRDALLYYLIQSKQN